MREGLPTHLTETQLVRCTMSDACLMRPANYLWHLHSVVGIPMPRTGIKRAMVAASGTTANARARFLAITIATQSCRPTSHAGPRIRPHFCLGCLIVKDALLCFFGSDVRGCQPLRARCGDLLLLQCYVGQRTVGEGVGERTGHNSSYTVANVLPR